MTPTAMGVKAEADEAATASKARRRDFIVEQKVSTKRCGIASIGLSTQYYLTLVSFSTRFAVSEYKKHSHERDASKSDVIEPRRIDNVTPTSPRFIFHDKYVTPRSGSKVHSRERDDKHRM